MINTKEFRGSGSVRITYRKILILQLCRHVEKKIELKWPLVGPTEFQNVEPKKTKKFKIKIQNSLMTEGSNTANKPNLNLIQLKVNV